MENFSTYIRTNGKEKMIDLTSNIDHFPSEMQESSLSLSVSVRQFADLQMSSVSHKINIAFSRSPKAGHNIKSCTTS